MILGDDNRVNHYRDVVVCIVPKLTPEPQHSRLVSPIGHPATLVRSVRVLGTNLSIMGDETDEGYMFYRSPQ